MFVYTVYRVGWNTGDSISINGVYERHFYGYKIITDYLKEIHIFTIKDLSKYGMENGVDKSTSSWYQLLTHYKVTGKNGTFDASYNKDSRRRIQEIKVPLDLSEKEEYNYKFWVLNNEGFYMPYPLKYYNHGIWGQHSYEQHIKYTNDYIDDSKRRIYEQNEVKRAFNKKLYIL